MPRIKRGGRELLVSDSEVTAYLEQGYAVIDEKGNELTRAKAVTYAQAMAENGDLKSRIKELTAALESAHTDIGKLKQNAQTTGDVQNAAKRADTTRETSKQEEGTNSTPGDKKGAKGEFGLGKPADKK